MTDVHTIKIRSKNMQAIKSKDTNIEITVRKLIRKLGYKYKLYPKLLGKPDLIIPEYSKIFFINGCFWHMHGCHLSSVPKSNTLFWKQKLKNNYSRDKRIKRFLNKSGWKIINLWECAIKGKKKISEDILLNMIKKSIKSKKNSQISCK